MTNKQLFTAAHSVARSMKQADSSLHYTLAFKEALRMVRERFARVNTKTIISMEMTVGAVANDLVRLFDNNRRYKAMIAARTERMTVKTIIRETPKAILAACTMQDGTVQDQQWFPKAVIDENGLVAEWFIDKNLPAFYSFI